MGVKTTYTGLEKKQTLIRCGTIFFVNPQKIWRQTTWVFGTVELEIHLDLTKNTSADLTFVS